MGWQSLALNIPEVAATSLCHQEISRTAAGPSHRELSPRSCYAFHDLKY